MNHHVNKNILLVALAIVASVATASAVSKHTLSEFTPGDEADRVIKKELKRATPSEGEAETSGPLVKSRSWTDSKGRSMTAELVSLDGNTGTFRKVGGSPFAYDITKLSEEDQKLIKEAAAK